ncbi:MAG: chemotaxis protein CheW [Acetivibrionales bacterium]|jgi:two-component system chemotaxis sensor kinase CheA
MPGQNSNEPMLDMFIFESTQLIEQLEDLILKCEKSSSYTQETINEIFRIMHTIKGSSAMMAFCNISTLAHTIEDLFYFIREQKPQNIDNCALSDLVLEGVDFIKVELDKIKNGNEADGDCSRLLNNIKDFLEKLRQSNALLEKPKKLFKKKLFNEKICNTFKAVIFFEDGCEMENVRAYNIIYNLKELVREVFFVPKDIDNNDSVQLIREQGFTVYVKTDRSYEEIYNFFMQTVFLKSLELVFIDSKEELKQFTNHRAMSFKLEQSFENVSQTEGKDNKESKCNERLETQTVIQSIVSVNVAKLDKLMDLMGEMVIAEAMVTQNPDLKGLELENFNKAARRLHKITSELQDVVMSIRMVPLSATFHKMHRIVRDMSKELNKEVELKIIGEETEVDKNIIEHISDPLMHLVRNSVDHGIEAIEDREISGKPKVGKITLEAKNAGSDVIITVKDDGRGLNKENILNKARENGLINKPENELTDKEIYNLILLPGFSTNDTVSQYSGRGVGMDVVVKNIEAIGGTVSISSVENAGSTITLKIPLTLAIIDGMNICVGNSRYTIPTNAIKESFRPKETDIIRDPDGYEMIMVRGQCYPIVRLHELFDVKTDIKDFTKGILIMVEQDAKTICIFADELLGQQQVVIKALPNYIKDTKKIRGLSGCTLLGDGSISLILDIGGLAGLENLP